jgi:hypothetical protein
MFPAVLRPYSAAMSTIVTATAKSGNLPIVERLPRPSAEVTPICQPPVYIADMPCRPPLVSASWMLRSDCLKRVLKSLPLYTEIQIYGSLVLFSFSRAQAAIVIIFHRSRDDYQPYVHETTSLAASQPGLPIDGPARGANGAPQYGSGRGVHLAPRIGSGRPSPGLDV